MRALAFIAGLLLAVMMLYDLFDTIILPKRAESHWRPTAMFFKYSWMPVRKIGRHIKSGAFRERFLSFYGPLSLVLLFVVWAAGIITGFALMDWDAGLRVGNSPATIGDSLYASANAFFTLGLVQRSGPELSFLLLLEAALGFGFLALLVGYLPVLYQAFSRREVRVSLLDPRAGSPPSAGELIRREGHSEH